MKQPTTTIKEVKKICRTVTNAKINLLSDKYVMDIKGLICHDELKALIKLTEKNNDVIYHSSLGHMVIQSQ